MKKIIMIAAVSLFVTNLMAQKNTLLVGGDLGFSSLKDENDTKTSSFNFTPTIGYQFTKNWTAGIVADVRSGKVDVSASPAYVSKTNFFGAGPFIRYAYPLSNIFAVYGQAQGLFGGGKSSLSISPNDEKFTQSGLSAFPAIGINMHNGLALNVSFGGITYTSSKIKGSTAKNTSFAFDFGSTTNIGLSKNFGFKKK